MLGNVGRSLTVYKVCGRFKVEKKKESAVIERVAVGSIKQRSLASSSCLECSQSYGDCVCEETSFQIAVAWLHKWSKSDGEALQWAAHKMTFI